MQEDPLQFLVHETTLELDPIVVALSLAPDYLPCWCQKMKYRGGGLKSAGQSGIFKIL
jgi:hypothetical protein